ncbi:MAG: DUF684 domain-containing protein [Alphaproteobacteria bacterium]|nr:DUF684 domain-containing protein [Alphaproteobacteria bacterium]MBU6472539.1 DUF684 domain-containing protein [Alphaproteobacteria bacterium]MDE2012952.1 hypothetical protein [Alphaproteobacteria bacterium]MDE2074591.1 hypothetical protein [Alphaproteobacteria bacterium]MDE2351427.1 hypothetical protein [Alphaproteobacteria bacterium]
MNKHLSFACQIGEWVREAYIQCGDNWDGINDYIEARMAGLSEEEKAEMLAEAAFTLTRGNSKVH